MVVSIYIYMNRLTGIYICVYLNSYEDCSMLPLDPKESMKVLGPTKMGRVTSKMKQTWVPMVFSEYTYQALMLQSFFSLQSRLHKHPGTVFDQCVGEKTLSGATVSWMFPVDACFVQYQEYR